MLRIKNKEWNANEDESDERQTDTFKNPSLLLRISVLDCLLRLLSQSQIICIVN